MTLRFKRVSCVVFFQQKGQQILFLALLWFSPLLVTACQPLQNNSGRLPPITHATLSAQHTLSNLFDPCSLFSKDDVSQILGGPVDVKPHFVAPLCIYTKASATPVGGSGTAVPDRRAVLVAIGKSDDAPGYFAANRSHTKGVAPLQVLSGVGETALFVPISGGKSIIVLKHPMIYSITVIDSLLSEAILQRSLLKLARLAEQTLIHNTPDLAVPEPNPCTLVTEHEAGQLLQNSQVKWLFTANDAGVESCDYIATTDVQKRLQVVTTNNVNLAKSLFTEVEQNRQDTKPVKGIGDAAFYDGKSTLWVLKGNSFLHFTLLGGVLPESTIEQLASKAVKRF